MKKFKTGLVLSGGGTRGFAHLGVISAMYEMGIKPDVISGVSAGSIAGAFIADGKSPDEILKIFKKGWAIQYTKLQIPLNGLLKFGGLKTILNSKISAKNIEDLNIPMFIGVSNLNKGIIEYKNSGSLDTTVLASSSIPILFSPVEIGENLYVDGGLMDNIPIEPIKNDCEQIIVVNISPLNTKGKIKNLVQVATRSFYMSVNANMGMVNKYATYFIEPEGIDNYDILLRTHADELFELGYKTAKSILKKKVLQ